MLGEGGSLSMSLPLWPLTEPTIRWKQSDIRPSRCWAATPVNIVAIKPMRDGVIAHFDLTEEMLKYFIRKAHSRKHFLAPRIVIGTPSEITQVEKRAIRDTAWAARASEVYLVEQAMAAAIGAGLPVTKAGGNLIIDIGGGTTDVAVISLSGICLWSLSPGGRSRHG